MKKWTLRDPGLIAEAKKAAFAPKVIFTLLLGVAVFAIYTFFSANAGVVYAAVYAVVKGDILALINLPESQPFYVFALMCTVVLIVLTLVYVLKIERRSAASMGLNKRGWARRYAAGYALGLVILAVAILPALLTEDIVEKGFTMLVPAFFAAFIVQAASEEIFFRGFLMPSVGAKMGIGWGVLISSVLFALAHIFNPGMSVTAMIAIFCIGLFLALYILRTGSILGACAIHAAWNFGTGLITQIDIGGYTIDYAVVQVGEVVPIEDVNILGNPIDLVAISVFILAICVVLLSGQNRLLVQREEAAEVAEEME